MKYIESYGVVGLLAQERTLHYLGTLAVLHDVFIRILTSKVPGASSIQILWEGKQQTYKHN